LREPLYIREINAGIVVISELLDAETVSHGLSGVSRKNDPSLSDLRNFSSSSLSSTQHRFAISLQNVNSPISIRNAHKENSIHSILCLKVNEELNVP
jgi:hypothetical protein